MLFLLGLKIECTLTLSISLCWKAYRSDTSTRPGAPILTDELECAPTITLTGDAAVKVKVT